MEVIARHFDIRDLLIAFHDSKIDTRLNYFESNLILMIVNLSHMVTSLSH